MQELYERLLETYGDHVWCPDLDPLSELIRTILSQHTSDLNSDRAFEELRRRFPTWEQVRDASVDDIADAIRCGGLAKSKAPRIKEVLCAITAEQGHLSLDILCDMHPDEAMAYLKSLRGIGAKSAACVLLFACGRAVFPVDTHIHRVARRLGLAPARASAEEVQTRLQAQLLPEWVYNTHVNLIRHGRQVCRAPQPRCEICVLTDLCAYYAGAADRAGRR